MNSVWAVAFIANGDSGKQVLDCHERSAPVAAVTDAIPQRGAPPTRLKPPAS
jgi:hypothetical protein